MRQSTQKFGLFLFKDEYIGQYSVLVHIVQKDQHFESPRPRPILSVYPLRRPGILSSLFKGMSLSRNLPQRFICTILFRTEKNTGM